VPPDPNNHAHVYLTRFFLTISIFLIAISILAVYSTVVATEYGAKKDDLQIVSLTHLLKSIDWLNDYEQQNIGEKLLQAQLDTLNLALHNFNSDHTNNTPTPIVNNSVLHKQFNSNPITKYGSYIAKLHADRSVAGSLANLKYNAESENSTYEKSLTTISETSKFITIYEFITILLIIGAGLCGISEIAKNKFLGYPGVQTTTSKPIVHNNVLSNLWCFSLYRYRSSCSSWVNIE
jgi:hypothetical protein